MKWVVIIAGVVALGLAGLVAVWVWVVQNVETPPHEVLRAEGAIELRRYPPLVVAEVARDGPRREALGAGFGPLARYIFARERAGPKIAMTAPVTQSPAGEGWTVAFIMPSDAALADLPAPVQDEVRLVERPAATRAAIRFSGHASDADIAEQERRLRDWIAREGLEPAGPPVYAYYNDPLTPGFLRRNEVLIEVAGPVGGTAARDAASTVPAD
jgi:hypothetical protein